MTLSNDTLTITIDPYGAELTSLCKDNQEYLWNGDSTFWNRHAPILFPTVGKPYNNELHIGGKIYTMKQHGFARDTMFEVIGAGRLRMVENTRAGVYPYYFVIEVTYQLNGNTMTAEWKVTNCDTKTLYFQIGAHPGFMLCDYHSNDTKHGYIRYYNAIGQTVSPTITSKLNDGNRIPRETPLVIPTEMPITNDTFVHDALIFEAGQVAAAELCNKEGKAILKVSCPQAEAFGIWAPHKPGCPFVCIEPWCGICDNKGFTDDIAKRTYIHTLEPNENYLFRYQIHLY